VYLLLMCLSVFLCIILRLHFCFILFCVLIIIAIMFCYILTAFYLVVDLGLGDICFTPDQFILGLIPNNTARDTLKKVLFCDAKHNPFNQTLHVLEGSVRFVNQSVGKLFGLADNRLAKAFGISAVIKPMKDFVGGMIQVMDSLVELAYFLDCATIQRHYNSAKHQACLILSGFEHALISTALTGLVLFLLLLIYVTEVKEQEEEDKKSLLKSDHEWD